MTRRLTAPLALLFIVLVIGTDLQRSPPNPFAAPPAFALGSGVAQSGGFCGALPD